MDDDTKFAILLLLIFIVVIAFAAILKKTQCEGGWEGSGMTAKWSIATGCLLETQPGKWIPADNYQERAP